MKLLKAIIAAYGWRPFVNVAVVVAFIAALLIGNPPAHADGILNARETQYVADNGESLVCAAIDGMPSPAMVITVAQSVMDDGFTADNAVDIVNASVLAYCEQHWPLLQQVGAMARGETT